MKYLITGGSGFLGSNLAWKRFVEVGSKVDKNEGVNRMTKWVFVQ